MKHVRKLILSTAYVTITLCAASPASGEVSTLSCAPTIVDPAKGLAVGCTFHDLQKYGSMGRQIDVDGTFHIFNFVWTNQANNIAFGGRNSRYEAYDPSYGFLGDGTGGVDIDGSLIPPSRSGFPTVATLSDGTAMLATQWNPTFPSGPFRPWITHTNTPGLDWNSYVVSDSVSAPYVAGPHGPNGTYVWPQVTHTDNGPIQFTHAIISALGSDTDPLNSALYTRRIGTAGDNWQVGMPLGPAGFHRSFVIAARRNSNDVAIAWSGSRGDGTPDGAPVAKNLSTEAGKNDNDIYVMISHDAGATWEPRMNITQRADSLPGGWAPHAKVSALWGTDGNLHVVWQARKWPGYGGEFTKQARLFHWDEMSGQIRTVYDANWIPQICSGGYQQLNADNPQISECDGKLYVTFTQFAPPGREDDCAERALTQSNTFGSANGDLYVTVSDNGGFIWDAPRNLTDSYTPNCDTIPGGANPDCASDVWQSTVRYGLDVTGEIYTDYVDFSANIGGYAGVNYLFLQYIQDADPGAAFLAEGGWTDNPVRTFRFGCVESVPGAALASSLPQIIPVVDTLEISGADSTLPWILENIGSVDINDLSVTLGAVTPPGHVTLTGFGSTLLAGANNADTGFITFNANQDSIIANATATVTVTGSFPTSPRTFTISYTVPEPPCCILAGDFDYDQAFNIADVTSGIAFIFSGGPGPVCCPSADFDQSGAYNIGDVTAAIAFIFAGGPAPACGPEDAVCGS